MQRALLHGIGEPLLNAELPEIIKYLKQRKVEVIINSNGTLLSDEWQRKLIESGLDQYRCSIDSATDATYAHIRGASLLPKLKKGLQGLVKTKERLGMSIPNISIWCVATRGTCKNYRICYGWLLGWVFLKSTYNAWCISPGNPTNNSEWLAMKSRSLAKRIISSNKSLMNVRD